MPVLSMTTRLHFSRHQLEKIAQLIGALSSAVIQRRLAKYRTCTARHSRNWRDRPYAHSSQSNEPYVPRMRKGTVVRTESCLSRRVEAHVLVTARADDLFEVKLTLWNMGFLSTSGLRRRFTVCTPVVQADIDTGLRADYFKQPVQTETTERMGLICAGRCTLFTRLPSPRQ